MAGEESPDFDRAAQGVTPLLGYKLVGGKSRQNLLRRRRSVDQRTSGTERMSGAMTDLLGTGDKSRAAGVKTAKLCAKQDQIGKRRKHGPCRASG